MCNEYKTWCNPLPIPNIPRGKDDWYKHEKEMFSHENKPDDVTVPDYRSISDPTVMYYDNKWYLYPSYGMAWVSEDFVTWKHYRTEPYCPKYSPHVVPWKDKFLMVSWVCPLYSADNPLGPFEVMGDFIKRDGTHFLPCDPGLFIDTDGRLYLYAFEVRESIMSIVGYELDSENPRQTVTDGDIILRMDTENHWWERFGKHNQNESMGWVEGPHMLKYNGRYYMIYAAPGTSEASYCMAAYYSDTSPLKGFICQKHNPITRRTDGLTAGAGHGCIEVGPNNTLWAFYTIPAPYTHCYERRIGMDMIAVNSDGELYAPFGITDTPQYQPGAIAEPLINGNSPKLYNLTGGFRPEASSCSCGRDALYATDESNITWWQPDDYDISPTLTCDIKGDYIISSARIMWKEVGLDYARGVVPGNIKYIIEGCLNNEWFVLYDGTKSSEEKLIDCNSFEKKVCDKVRITIKGKPDGMKVGIIDFTVFGVKNK